MVPITSMKRKVPHASATIKPRVRIGHWSPVPPRHHRSQCRHARCWQCPPNCHCGPVDDTVAQRPHINHDEPNRHFVHERFPVLLAECDRHAVCHLILGPLGECDLLSQRLPDLLDEYGRLVVTQRLPLFIDD